MPEKPKPIERLVPVAIFALLVFGIYFAQKPAVTSAPKLTVTYFNVGQGDSALISTPHNHKYLIDGGPDKSVLTSLGGSLGPIDKEIDGIIVSHPHADHIAGINYVLDRYQVKKVYLVGTKYEAPEYQAFIEKITSLNIERIKIYQGYSFQDDGANFSFYWPHQDEGNAPPDVNDDSAVLNVNYQNNNFLFLGDLSTKMQEKMITETNIPAVNVVKISHHGSKTGTSIVLMENLKPEYAVISVGKNSFGHPAPSVLEKLGAQKVLRTDELGDIRFQSDGNALVLVR